jgi:branched-chain amino acid transport system ATP-binding protein
MLLEVNNIKVVYGQNMVLTDVALNVNEREVVVLLGSNGAGKTTTLRAISGLTSPVSGEIRFEGKPIQSLPPEKIVRYGISHAPERRKLFPKMSVKENLDMGAYIRKNKQDIDADIEQMYSMFPILKKRCDQRAGTLSGGEQQMLCIARALLSKPKLLLLDEPTLGLAPVIVDQLADIIRRINSAGTSILLVEQNAHMALNVSQRAYLLEKGKIILDGYSKDLINDDKIKKGYLGL